MTERIKKINQLLKRELSQIILREIEFPGALVTLTRVETSSNLIESKIFISIIPESKQKEFFDQMKYNVWHIQQLLNKRLKMRPTPKIIFLAEKQTAQAGNIENVLEKIKGLKKR
jgi:ribosome-binding factor A